MDLTANYDTQSLLEIAEELGDYDERKAKIINLIKSLQEETECKKCKNLVFNPRSCEFCVRKYLEVNFDTWSSGNEKIDELIQNCQKNTIRPDSIIEWIPFKNLQNIQYMAEGNFFKTFSAIWTGGRYVSWAPNQQKLKRNKYNAYAVTVKHVNLNPDPDQWFQEINTHLSLSASNSPIILSYGLTQETESTNYMIVMESVKYTLKSYLQDTTVTRKELTWFQKYKILLDISLSLESIHEKQLVYRGLNPVNIMYSNREERWLIGDFGLCRPVDFLLNEVQGTIPYTSPEILKIRTNQTSVSLDITSDIYSFGMIMWEISTTYQPFKNRHPNLDLIKDIINNKRPEIMDGTPSKYSELMARCWSGNVTERPSIKEIQNEIQDVLSNFDKKSMLQEEMNLMNIVNIVNFNDTPSKQPFDEEDLKTNPGFDADAEFIEIISPKDIRNERSFDGIGLISEAMLHTPEEIRKVAIKSLKIDNITRITEEFYLKSLQQKIHEMDLSIHPNIVEFLGLGIKDEDKLFFVMPWANGDNLRNYYNENKSSLSFDSKIEIAKGIAMGVKELHDKKIVHANLNPENILMFDETPKISNLPLPYKNVEFYFKNKEYYFDNSLFSVIGYVDPNFFHNKGFKKSKSVDIYSFGSILWEILSEKIPYSEESDLLKLVSDIKEGYREASIAKISVKIDELIKKCWGGDGSERGTIEDVIEIIEDVIDTTKTLGE